MTEQELAMLDDASLTLLEDVGVRLEHDGIIASLLAAGARPGHGAQEVRLPRAMVREYLALVPSTVELTARNGTSARITPTSPSVCWTNPAMNIWNGAECREVTSTDLADIARLCDHLPNVQGILGLAMDDIPPTQRDFVGLRVIAENCRKHIRVLCFTPTGMEALAEMRKVFPGNWFSIGFTAHGPLRWTWLALEIFRKSAGLGIPATINGEPMAGVTGPVTPAGSIAVGNAEILAGIVLNQVLEPGRPLIYNLGLAHVFDMRNATAVTGGPENALFAQASAALGRYYHLPSSSWVSTEAVYDDAQAALEKTFGFTTHLQQGVGVVWGMGQLESEKTISLGQLVMDDEIISYIRRYLAGIAVNDETLQLDLIREVGIAGSFLETEHTLLNYREQLFAPGLLNRAPRANCPQPMPATAYRRAAEFIAGDQEQKIGDVELAELLRIEEHYRQ